MSWLREFKPKLALRETRIKEIKRFFRKWGFEKPYAGRIDKITLGSISDVYDAVFLEKKQVYVECASEEVSLKMSRTSNKPFIYIKAELEVAGKTLQIINSTLDGKTLGEDALQQFSDLSLLFADVLADVLKGFRKEVIGTEFYNELIVTDDQDTVIVAYNYRREDC